MASSVEVTVPNGQVGLHNYIKLQHLINTTASNCLRQMFIREWKQSMKSDWQNLPCNGRQFISSCQAASGLYHNCRKIQKDLLASGNVDRWDIPLLANSIKLFPSSSPTMTARERDKGLDTLKEQRNKLSHLGNTQISEAEFNLFWDPVYQTLLKFGVPEAQLEDFQFTTSGSAPPPPEPSNPSIPIAQALRDEGNELFKHQNYSKAIEKYTEAILLPGLPSQDVAALYSNRSVSYLKVKEFKSAKSDAKGAVMLNPIWSKGYFRLAAAYDALTNSRQALKNYEIAAGLEPNLLKKNEIRDSLYQCRFRTITENASGENAPIPFHMTIGDLYVVLRKGVNATAHGLPDLRNLNLNTGNPLRMAAEGTLLASNKNQDREALHKAARLFSDAAAKGSAEGLYNLACFTLQGIGGRKQDFEEALRLLLAAANMSNTIQVGNRKLPNVGVAESMHLLGLCYADGIGVEKDVPTGISWYEKGIQSGSGASCYNLALMYTHQRHSVKQDRDRAVALLCSNSDLCTEIQRHWRVWP